MDNGTYILKVIANDLPKSTLGVFSRLIEETATYITTGDRPVLDDIKHIDQIQSSFLNPKQARRTDKSLVPIYSLTGSNPGGLFFMADRPFINFGKKYMDLRHSFYDIFDHYGNLGEDKVATESAAMTLMDMMGAKPKGKGNSRGLEKDDQPINMWTRRFAGVSDGDQFNTHIHSFGVLLGLGLVPEMGLGIKEGRDGYFDSDGMVGFESGHALKIGNNPLNFMDHNGLFSYGSRRERGSWYRIFGEKYGRSHPWDYDNHRSICFNTGTAAFIKNFLIDHAGPRPSAASLSEFDGGGTQTQLKTQRIIVEITGVKDLSGGIDPAVDQADFQGSVKVANGKWQKGNVIEGKDVANRNSFQDGKNYIWHFKGPVIPNSTLVPVILKVRDADSGLYFGDDHCSASPDFGREDVVIFVDTRHGKVYGDVEGKLVRGVNTFVSRGHPKNHNRIELRFRIKVVDVE